MTLLRQLMLLVLATQCHSFAPVPRHPPQNALWSSSIESETVPLNTKDLDDLKDELVRLCKSSPKPGLDMIRSLAQQVEQVGEQVCIVSLQKKPISLYQYTLLTHPPSRATRSLEWDNLRPVRGYFPGNGTLKLCRNSLYCYAYVPCILRFLYFSL